MNTLVVSDFGTVVVDECFHVKCLCWGGCLKVIAMVGAGRKGIWCRKLLLLALVPLMLQRCTFLSKIPSFPLPPPPTVAGPLCSLTLCWEPSCAKQSSELAALCQGEPCQGLGARHAVVPATSSGGWGAPNSPLEFHLLQLLFSHAAALSKLLYGLNSHLVKGSIKLELL